MDNSTNADQLNTIDEGDQLVGKEDLLEQLVGLDFDRETALLAIQFTGGKSADLAVNWILENPEIIADLLAARMGANTSTESVGNFAANLFGNSRSHKMVFVVNSSLRMGAGKMAAQVGHAAVALFRLCQRSKEGNIALEEWNTNGEMKIVLRGESTEMLEELYKQAREAPGVFAYLVHDAGHTQIPSGSRTVLGIFGTLESVDKITGNLKLF